MADLTASARTLLGDRGSQSTLTRVAETLRSAATEATGRELLARGRLTVELSDTGWDTVAALAPGQPRGRGKPGAAGRPAKRAEGSARSRARRAGGSIRGNEGARERLAEETRLRNELEAAEAEVEAARTEVAAIEQRLENAQQELRELTES